MSINCYLAMTAAEFSSAETLPQHVAWMACHFSCYGAGISNLPTQLPPKSIVIVNDRTPISGHDPQMIAGQLRELIEAFDVHAVLLDFQRPDVAQTQELVNHLVDNLPCPVGVTQYYLKGHDSPVFLPPVPLDMTAEEYLSGFSGRQIWLEAATADKSLEITKDGYQEVPKSVDIEEKFADNRLHCHYGMEIQADRVIFNLVRDKEDLSNMLSVLEDANVSLAIGLYQQLKE